MTWDDPSTVLTGLLLMWTIGFSVFTTVSNRRKASRQEMENAFQRGSTRMGEIEGRLYKVETAIEHMPSKEQFAELHGDLKALNAKINGIDKLVDRMDEFLKSSGVPR